MIKKPINVTHISDILEIKLSGAQSINKNKFKAGPVCGVGLGPGTLGD